jgi:hypothetical protein
LLLVAILAWVAVRLWWGAGDAGTAVAAATLGALAIQANIDYSLHFVPVVVAAGTLLGAGSTAPRRGAYDSSEPRRRSHRESGFPDRWDWTFLDPPDGSGRPSSRAGV